MPRNEPPMPSPLAAAQRHLDRIQALWDELPPNSQWRSVKYRTVVEAIRVETDALRKLLKEQT